MADKYLDFLAELNCKTTEGEAAEETFDITAKDLQNSELSFRWGRSGNPDVELIEK